MSIWVGISPLIGAGSLEGFAVGATVSGALFLAITAPRRARRRLAAAAGIRGLPASASSAATSSAETRSAQTSSAETKSTQTRVFDTGLCDIAALAAEAERVAQQQPRVAQPQNRVAQPQPPVAHPQPPMAQPQRRVAQPQPGAQDDANWTSPAGRDAVPAVPADRDGGAAGYRSRHRLGDPSPGGGGALVGRSRRSRGFPPRALSHWAPWDGAQPDTPLPDVAFPDAAFADGTFRSSRRPQVRRLPRHAAPTVSFGTKVSGRVTGLFAARPLAGGAPS
jgi:hypothetical protein